MCFYYLVLAALPGGFRREHRGAQSLLEKHGAS
jgi:hypothetical protein